MSDDNHWNRMSDARSDKTGFCFWGKTNYTTGMASMLGNYEALGYICMGILAFALGVCVTILLYRLRKAEEHRKKAEEYKQSQQVRENRLKKE